MLNVDEYYDIRLEMKWDYVLANRRTRSLLKKTAGVPKARCTVKCIRPMALYLTMHAHNLWAIIC